MIRWSSDDESNAPDAASRARSEQLLADAKSAAVLRHKLALMDIAAQHIAGHRSHFNPNQPRVPAGNPDGGQWTNTGGGTGSRLAAAEKPRLGRRTVIPLVLEAAKRLIKAYRSERGLWDLFERKEGTVAFAELDGTKVFGANSTSPAYTSADEVAAIELRNVLMEKYPKNFRAEHVGQMPNDALFHAETTVLLRAARQAGGTLAGRTLTVHVDAKLCNNCQKVLPYVGLEVGNPTVTFVDPKGLTKTMRDGAWLD
jgi:MafB19-like deaminase